MEWESGIADECFGFEDGGVNLKNIFTEGDIRECRLR